MALHQTSGPYHEAGPFTAAAAAAKRAMAMAGNRGPGKTGRGAQRPRRAADDLVRGGRKTFPGNLSRSGTQTHAGRTLGSGMPTHGSILATRGMPTHGPVSFGKGMPTHAGAAFGRGVPTH